MRITVRTASARLSELARRRFEFVLGRFPGRVQSLAVRVTDVNGPRGGVDKRCRATLRLAASQRVLVIEDADTDAAAVIGRVADRTGRTVARAIGTLRDWRPRQNRW